MKRLCLVTTTDLIVNFFLRDHLRALGERYDLTLIVNTADRNFLNDESIKVKVEPVAIERPIAPLADALALARLFWLLSRGRFDGVISIAPKAGLLVSLAAFAARIPFRCHVFQGEVWATKSGLPRRLLKALDRIVARLSTHLLVISRSEQEFLEREAVVAKQRLQLIAQGSIGGVDLQRFRADAELRRVVRDQLQVPQDAPVILFLGRLTRDKGVLDLVRAFRDLAEEDAALHLVCIGPDEGQLHDAIKQTAGPHTRRLRVSGFTSTPERYIASADILALPSYREGFGNVIIEAAAAGIPAVASAIYGICDALIDGETGLLHPPGDVAAIAQKLRLLLDDTALRGDLGRKARERAHRDFSSVAVIGFWLAYVESALGGQHVR